MSLEAIGRLDILTFNALLSSVMRVTYDQRTEAAWTSMIAAQGTQQAMTKWVKEWAKATGRVKQGKDDLKAFLRDFGGGI